MTPAAHAISSTSVTEAAKWYQSGGARKGSKAPGILNQNENDRKGNELVATCDKESAKHDWKNWQGKERLCKVIETARSGGGFLVDMT